MKTVGIIGYGFVGKATGQLAIKNEIKVIPFDLYNDDFNSPAQMLAAYDCDYVFVCVPTPPDPEDGRLDVSIVADSVKKWSELRQNQESILVIKSTIPVGTVDELCEFFETDLIVHNPEFLTERTAMEDFMDADEIIVGGPNEDAVRSVLNLYDCWAWVRAKNIVGRAYYEENLAPNLVATDAKTAEMVKTVRNSFYAMKVEYMNEVADLCDAMNVDYAGFREVFARSGRHAWVNPMHTVVPGPDGKRGFGGKCLPKDSMGLAALGDTHGVDMALLKTTNKKNKIRRPDEYPDSE